MIIKKWSLKQGLKNDILSVCKGGLTGYPMMLFGNQYYQRNAKPSCHFQHGRDR